MFVKEITLKLPTDYTEDSLRKSIAKELGTDIFSYSIDKKSLDARRKYNIHWVLKVLAVAGVSDATGLGRQEGLDIPFSKRNKKAVVAGSGPAGFFCAFVLAKAGFDVTIVERGGQVSDRITGIKEFEEGGEFDPRNNYAFGEGGAGTFSDGKLTARSKHNTKEKDFIIERYINAGAPDEIAYMAHPHLGSDNLKVIVANLRKEFQKLGGKILFSTMLEDITVSQGKVTAARVEGDTLEADYFIFAAGHSAYETYRMLIERGVQFRTKNFAVGCRVEHPQEIINKAQWGVEALPGVKAAEYRLTSNSHRRLPVYTFCMCPGGIVVPSAPYADVNIVNGMSRYLRNEKFANAACVAAVNLSALLEREVSALESLEWLQALEERFFAVSESYQAPACTIKDFVERKVMTAPAQTSYPLGLLHAPLWELLPEKIDEAIRDGLRDFNGKIRGFNNGTIMGLESKTSAPVQVVREDDMRCASFDNLYVVGEGSGWAGGIISSGADGIRAAMNIIKR